ncbi:dimethylamine monooxygenase subunit DmmA family protein [Terrilactibacillus tamarindi]|nr:dimethylamine monooxygenase subunit DmmA family protein [Terrilactibacillus tamarindi]
MDHATNKNFTFVTGRRKYLLFTDITGYGEITPILSSLDEQNLLYMVYYFNEFSSNHDLKTYLSQQKMGTYIYASGNWNSIISFVKTAEKAGFTEEELQIKGIGERILRVFCSRCYAINVCKTSKEMVCQSCGQSLSVSNHYSRRYDAYLGYTILN